MDAGVFGWLAASVAAWWIGITGAEVRHELMELEDAAGEEHDYRVLSLLRRLRDDTVGLGLRLRFSRFLSAAITPVGAAVALIGLGSEAAGAGFMTGWLLVGVADRAGGSALGRGAARLAGGRGFTLWSRVTAPASRFRALAGLRGGEGETESGRGLVLAETQAALTPSGARLGREERRLLRRLLASTAILVSDIMTRWSSVSRLDESVTVAEAIPEVLRSGRSRHPVVGGGKVRGVVSVKDLLAHRAVEGSPDTRVGAIRREVYFVPETETVQALLDQLQQAHVHLAVVVDRLGRAVGLVTVEDILEEIVGELYDEREAPEVSA